MVIFAPKEYFYFRVHLSRAKRVHKRALLAAELFHIAPCQCHLRTGCTFPRAASITEAGWDFIRRNQRAAKGHENEQDGSSHGYSPATSAVSCPQRTSDFEVCSKPQPQLEPGKQQPSYCSSSYVTSVRGICCAGNGGCGSGGGDSIGITDTESSHVVADQATTWEWSQAAPAVLTEAEASESVTAAPGVRDETVTPRGSAATAGYYCVLR